MRKLKLFPKIFIYTLRILGTLVAIAHLFLYFAFQRFCLPRGERGEGEAQLGEGRKS